MTFEQALKDGDLDVARAILDELAELAETGGLYMPECYADLARSYDRRGRHDDAIATHARAIELGWSTIPDPRSDIAEFHLRAGRKDEAAAMWAELKAADPDDVWLYNAAGLSYNEVGEHELKIQRKDGKEEIRKLTVGEDKTVTFDKPVVAQAGGDVRVAATGASQDGVMRVPAIEAALKANWLASAIDGVNISAAGLMSDIHGTSDYRANLIKVMAQRAVTAAG